VGAEDFVADLRGALAAAPPAGVSTTAPSTTRRIASRGVSFDLREKRLFDQLDDEERKAIERLKTVVGRNSVEP